VAVAKILGKSNGPRLFRKTEKRGMYIKHFGPESKMGPNSNKLP